MPSPPPPLVQGRNFVWLLAALSAIGPFSIDTFLPAMFDLQTSLNATPIQAQQAFTAYLLGFGIMGLWHGSISDAVGRRPVLCVGLFIYSIASLICTVALSIEILLWGRLLQGLSGGVGVIVARAMIRDCFDGVAAQRIMSSITQIFAIAPAVAPIIGGYMQMLGGWRATFGFLWVGSLCLLLWTLRSLPETLAVEKRQSLKIRFLWTSYTNIFTHGPALLLMGVIGIGFSPMFIYITASPTIIMRHLGLGETSFWVQFIPMIGGMILGSGLAIRWAGKKPQADLINLGLIIMSVGAVTSVIMQLIILPVLLENGYVAYSSPSHIILTIFPLPLLTVGYTLGAPSLQMRLMDLFPLQRGLVSSCQGSVQMLSSALAAGLVVPIVMPVMWHIALASSAFLGVTWLLWWVYQKRMPLVVEQPSLSPS